MMVPKEDNCLKMRTQHAFKMMEKIRGEEDKIDKKGMLANGRFQKNEEGVSMDGGLSLNSLRNQRSDLLEQEVGRWMGLQMLMTLEA